MPVIKLKTPERPKPKTLAEVGENEWWLSEGGNAFCHVGSGTVLRCSRDGSPYLSGFNPRDLFVVHKLSDPIILTW